MFCNQCGQRIADDSRFCKFCGGSQTEKHPEGLVTSSTPPLAKKPVLSGKMVGAIIAAFVLILIIIGQSSGDPKAGSQIDVSLANPSTALDATNETVSASADRSRWTYSTDVDKVRAGTTYFASTTSVNSIEQNFPYDSATTMDLTIRKSPAHGTDVILTISSGQMMCPSYQGCSGTVRFDEGPPQSIRFNGPADNSNDTVFVVGAKDFIAKLRKAKKVVIEKTLYEAGNPQFEFDVSGLKWEH